MKLKLNCLIKFFILISGYNFLLGQSYYPFDISFNQKLLFIEVNPYELSKNPALLEFDKSDELLRITSSVNTKSGDYKSTFDPRTHNIYSVTFSGKKKLDDSKIFNGTFGFIKDERKNWLWIFSKNYKTGNPFLLGDFSSGYSRFNGIHSEASYSEALSNRLSLGGMISYLVDEGLKNVSPRPESKHLNISLKIGFSYKFSQSLINAVSLKFTDLQEEIIYKEDQESVLKEITLLKFRGIDFPIVVNKKTESKIVYDNNYELNYDIFYFINHKFKVAFSFLYGIFQSTSKENLIQPQLVGYFQNSFNSQQLIIDYHPIKRTSVFLLISNSFSNSWAKHPNYNILLSDNSLKIRNILLRSTYFFASQNFLQGTLGLEKYSNYINDYHSNVFSKVNSFIYTLGIKFKHEPNFKIGYEIGYFICKYIPSNKELIYTTPSKYFFDYRIKDIQIIHTPFIEQIISTILEYNSSSIGKFILSYSLSFLKPNNINEIQTNSNFSLEFRLKAN